MYILFFYKIGHIQPTGKTITESTQLTKERIGRGLRRWSIVKIGYLYTWRIKILLKIDTTEISTNTYIYIMASVQTFDICNSFQWRIMSVSCDLSPPNQGTELLSLRLAVSGSIVDPWVYILLRKETLRYIHKIMQRYQRNYDVNLQSSTSHDMNSM